jgi:hypothetical protein
MMKLQRYYEYVPGSRKVTQEHVIVVNQIVKVLDRIYKNDHNKLNVVLKKSEVKIQVVFWVVTS